MRGRANKIPDSEINSGQLQGPLQSRASDRVTHITLTLGLKKRELGNESGDPYEEGVPVILLA